MSAPGDEAPPVPAAPAEPEPARPRLTRDEMREKRVETLKEDMKWASALLFVLMLAVSAWFLPGWGLPTNGEEHIGNVTDSIFSTGEWAEKNDSELAAMKARKEIREPGLVVPFEVLSVLLLAALIAGVVIALRERPGDL